METTRPERICSANTRQHDISHTSLRHGYCFQLICFPSQRVEYKFHRIEHKFHWPELTFHPMEQKTRRDKKNTFTLLNIRRNKPSDVLSRSSDG